MFPLGVRSFDIFALKLSLFLLVAGCHLINVEMIFTSPLQACSFHCCFSNNYVNSSCPEALQFYCDSSCHSLIHSLTPMIKFYSLVPEACDVALLGQSCCSIKIMLFPCFI